MAQKKSEKSDGNLLVRMVKGSVILNALDRFSAYLYTLLKYGLFGWIFTGYNPKPNFRFGERWRSGKVAGWLHELRYGICRRIESSVILYAIQWFMHYLLGCRLKVYGTFFASFGIYTTVVAVVTAIMRNSSAVLMNNPAMILSYTAILASVPLILSKKTLAEGLTDSVIGRLILKITGFTAEDTASAVGDGGHTNVAFLLGVICGVLSYTFSPLWFFLLFGGSVAAYLVLIRPELGVFALFVMMPWLPTMLLAGLVIYTSIACFFKLLRQKRILRFEPIDVMAMAFLVLLFFGGTVSLSHESLKPGLLMVCLMLGYFLTVILITTREWLVRCSVGAVVSATLESLYGIAMYFTGGGYSSQAWLDDEMFEAIRGRAVGTLENPNMFGEYLILILPIAVAMLIGRGEGLKRLQSLFCVGVMGVCLILTWSRGAWIGLIAAALVFLFIWTRRSVWLVLAGIAALPLLPSILPASVLARFTSIGNMADSSTSYRVYIWRASVNMIRDYFFIGIGIGQGAWFRIYPLYSYQGVEVAPHSHNLYLQIWLELGICGLLVFVGFLFLLFQAAFTLFGQLSGGAVLKNPDISAGVLDRNLAVSGERRQFDMQRGKIQLRLSTAGPLCGIVAVLVQGMTDYAWYNYRLFLMFWLVAGLTSAYTRNGRAQIAQDETINDRRTGRRLPDR